jgi:CRISPR-associated protein (TIGR03986 family)
MSAPTPPNEPILPRHVDPENVQRLSYAPYNFVPLPDAVMLAPLLDDGTAPWQKHDVYAAGLHSGWIDLTILAETPLYVRCAPPVEHASDDEARSNRHRQEFFHHGDPQRPVLPGSSLRGMIRSLVEVLAHAKLTCGLFSDRRLIYRAVGDTTSLGIHYRDAVLGPNQAQLPRMRFEYPVNRLRGGYLRRRGSDWFIQPAQTINGETFVHIEYNAANVPARPTQQPYDPQDLVRVYLRPPTGRTTPRRSNRNLILNLAHIQNTADVVRVQENTPCPTGFVPAVVVRSGHMTGGTKKHMHCAIYEPDDSIPVENWIPIDRDLWEAYEEDRDLTRGLPSRPLRNDGDPLFYLVDDQGRLVFFGPTMMFRMPYPHWLAEFVPERLRRNDEIDLAEAIFGRVQPSAIKGRVFVEDAVWDGQGGSPFYPDNDGRRTPHILGTPKPTAFQHYLVQPHNQQQDAANRPLGADRQTLCNYHHPLEGGPHDLTNNQGVLIGQTDGTVIRGYKRYWHQPGANDTARFATQMHPTQGTIICPVKKGTNFRGRLRFENLTDLELGALLTALQLPPSKRHHLGMGKPLGLGSVRIAASLHLTNREQRYASLFDDAGRANLGETNSDTVTERCREAFACAVVLHHNATSTPPVANGAAGLWSIPRLRALSALLEWDNAPPGDRVGYAPPNARPGNLRWWRDRRVLPTAEFVAGVPTGGTLLAPSAAAPSVPTHPTRPTGVPSLLTNYRSGTQVDAVLLSERTRKGGWKATIAGTALTGPVQGTPPTDAESGQTVRLVIASYTPPHTVSFWWPHAAPKKKSS